MAQPIVIVSNGYGIPVRESTSTPKVGVPVEVASNGKGIAVQVVTSGGIPVIGLP